MSGWDFENDSNTSKVEFTKFAPGITQIRIIDEDPNVRWVHWMKQFNRSINCPGRGCPVCEIRKQQKANKESYTYNMAKRFSMNIENLDTGKIELMEQGITFFQDLRDVKDDVMDKTDGLINAIIKVKRRGTTKDDTSYRLDLGTIDKLTAEAREELRSKATDLNEYFKPNTPEQILRLLQGEAWEDVFKYEENEEEIEIS